MPRYRNLAVLALTVFLSFPVLAAPSAQAPGGDSLLTRIVRLIKHLVPSTLDDISFPRP